MPRSRKNIYGEKPNVNMSPMIDLVFLLLIFFMVASKMITVPRIEGVEIPIAVEARVPKDAQGRVVINVRRDGEILDIRERVLQPLDVQRLMEAAKRSNPKTRLHLRVDQDVAHKHVEEVMQASARGGVSDVIFSTYVAE
ncbi:MAG: biopolymer transporter ExbD [Verrucomicrobiota bacterium]